MAKIKETDNLTVVIEDLNGTYDKQIAYVQTKGHKSINSVIAFCKKEYSEKLKKYKGKKISFWILAKPSLDHFYKKVTL